MTTLSFLFVSTVLCLGFQTQAGTVRGTVISPETKKPVANASVYIRRTNFEAKTDSDGKFTLKSVPAGTYDIEISKEDFTPTMYRGLAVRPDSILTLDVPLFKYVPLFKSRPSIKPRMRIITPDSSIHYRMRYMPIPKQKDQD